MVSGDGGCDEVGVGGGRRRGGGGGDGEGGGHGGGLGFFGSRHTTQRTKREWVFKKSGTTEPNFTHTNTAAEYQWDICMYRLLCCQPVQHGGHATDISSSDNELYLVIGAFTAHHVLPAAIPYPSDHWPASDDPCRISQLLTRISFPQRQIIR